MPIKDDHAQFHLVLMPGLDGTGICFRPLLKALPGDIPRTVIKYPDDRIYNLDEYADYVASRLPDMNTILVAESFAGLVALTMLHGRPPRVKGVVFSATFAEPLHRRLIRILSATPGMTSLVKRLPAWLLNAFLFRSAGGKDLEDMLREALLEIDGRGLKQRASIIASGYPYLDEHFHIPCVYLSPTRDRVVPGKAAGWFSSHFSSCRIIRFNAPHCLFQTNPDETAEIITAFAKELLST